MDQYAEQLKSNKVQRRCIMCHRCRSRHCVQVQINERDHKEHGSQLQRYINPKTFACPRHGAERPPAPASAARKPASLSRTTYQGCDRLRTGDVPRLARQLRSQLLLRLGHASACACSQRSSLPKSSRKHDACDAHSGTGWAKEVG